MNEQNKPQQSPNHPSPHNANPPKKQDETHKHAPHQGPEVGAPGRSDGEHSPKIQTPQK